MEEIFFDPRGSTVSFLWFMIPWLGLFILWLINLRRYEFDPNWGFSRKTRKVGGLVTSFFYFGLLWYLLWTNFFIIQISPNRNQLVLTYLVPERRVMLSRDSIDSIEADHVLDMGHYTGSRRKSLIIRTRDGKTYYSSSASPQWVEEQEKRLKKLLGMHVYN